MLYLHVTIYTVGETFSASKDFEGALVEETNKTLTDFSGELDVGFAFSRGSCQFQNLSLWMMRVSDCSETDVSKHHEHVVEPVPSYKIHVETAVTKSCFGLHVSEIISRMPNIS